MGDSKTQREQRLAAALRANLHRRKQQARERAGSAPSEDSGNEASETSEPARSGGKT